MDCLCASSTTFGYNYANLSRTCYRYSMSRTELQQESFSADTFEKKSTGGTPETGDGEKIRTI